MFGKVCLGTFKRIILIWVIFSSKLKYFPNYIGLAPFGAIIKDLFDCAAYGTNQCEHTTSSQEQVVVGKLLTFPHLMHKNR